MLPAAERTIVQNEAAEGSTPLGPFSPVAHHRDPHGLRKVGPAAATTNLLFPFFLERSPSSPFFFFTVLWWGRSKTMRGSITASRGTSFFLFCASRDCESALFLFLCSGLLFPPFFSCDYSSLPPTQKLENEELAYPERGVFSPPSPSWISPSLFPTQMKKKGWR